MAIIQEDKINLIVSNASANVNVVASSSGKTNVTVLKNDITAAERAKLAGIEAGADITDSDNVLASGAVMTTGDQSIDGTKTFTGSLSINGAYNFPTSIGSTTQVLKVNAAQDGLEFGDASVVANLNDLSDVNADFNANNLIGVNFAGQQVNWSMSRALIWDPVDNKVKLKEDTPEYWLIGGTQGSPGPGQQFVFETIASLGGGPSLGLHTANGVLSVNQAGQIPSTLKFYVNGNSRINGVIEVGDTSGVTYAFPSTDGTANQLLATDGSGAVTFVTPSTSNVTEGTNLYYTDARVAANSAVAANTAKTSFPGFGTTAGTALEGDTALFDGQYSSLTGVPSTFAPSAHTHTASEITDFDTEVSNNTSVAANTAKVGYTDAAVDSRIAAASIDDLSDVDTSTVAPTDGQALVWDNANSKWEPGTVSGGGSSPWTTSGSDIYYTTGNVGVGTSSPGVALDIAGQINATSSTFPVLGFTRETTLTSGAFTGTNGIASAMELTTKTSGDMGDGFGGGIVFTLNDATETSTTNYVARIYARRDGADNTGALQFFTGASGNDPSMIIRGSGNVGIGTTTPAEALDVSGKANINDGSNNVLISTGNSTITATNTVGVGYQALTALTTGTNNTAVGYQAGSAVTTGYQNVFVGNSVEGSTSLNKSVLIGYDASASSHESVVVGNESRAGYRSVSVGCLANPSASGGNNVSIGSRAARYTTGATNTVVGSEAAQGVSGSSTFSSTVAVGYQALTALTTGGSNTALGDRTSKAITSGSGNTSVGILGLSNVTTTSNNTSVGAQALQLTTGSNNTAVGFQSGNSITTNSDNTLLGYASGVFNTGAQNVAIGSRAMYGSPGTSTAGATVAVGYQALTALTTGTQNTAVGYQAGDALTTGVNNTLVGYAAGTALTGSSNAIFGNSAGTAMTSGTGNVVVGSYAGNSITIRHNNVAIGNGANVGSSTDHGVAIGGSATASGGYTTAMGYFAGNGSSGQWNVLNGFNTMRNSSGSYNAVCGGRSMYATDGSYNAVMGQGAMDGGGSNNDYNVAIGYNAFQNGSNNVIIGANAASASGTLTNKLYIENSNSTTPLIYGEFDNDLVKINGDFEVTGGIKIEKTSNTDYDYRGDVVYFGATTSMTQGDLYYFNSSGNWAQADANAVASSGSVLLAIALGAASDTDGMLLRGTFTMEATAIDGTEATGDELYVGTTAGHVTSDVSAYTTGDVVRVIGYCLDGTNGQIWFNPSNDFITLA